MKKVFVIFMLFSWMSIYAQNSEKLEVKWEELTVPNFTKAVEKSGKVCILPLGVIEKHGPHMPLGTDLIAVRSKVIEAVKEEYAVVFPEFYLGQINEARHQPGTISYSPELVWEMLIETCDEIARNGFNKIIFVNGHGGNNSLLPYFCMSLLSQKRGYAVYLFQPQKDEQLTKKSAQLMKDLPPNTDGHAGVSETSVMLHIRPELVEMDQTHTESGKNMDRLASIPNSYTGIWWFAKQPHHYMGDAKYSTAEIGKALHDEKVEQLVKMIKEVKADTKVLELQNEFYEESEHPIDTEQQEELNK